MQSGFRFCFFPQRKYDIVRYRQKINNNNITPSARGVGFRYNKYDPTTHETRLVDSVQEKCCAYLVPGTPQLGATGHHVLWRTRNSIRATHTMIDNVRRPFVCKRERRKQNEYRKPLTNRTRNRAAISRKNINNVYIIHPLVIDSQG